MLAKACHAAHFLHSLHEASKLRGLQPRVVGLLADLLQIVLELVRQQYRLLHALRKEAASVRLTGGT